MVLLNMDGTAQFGWVLTGSCAWTPEGGGHGIFRRQSLGRTGSIEKDSLVLKLICFWNKELYDTPVTPRTSIAMWWDFSMIWQSLARGIWCSPKENIKRNSSSRDLLLSIFSLWTMWSYLTILFLTSRPHYFLGGEIFFLGNSRPC